MPLCDFTPTVLLLILVSVANNGMQLSPTTSKWKKSISPFKIPVFNKAIGEARAGATKQAPVKR